MAAPRPRQASGTRAGARSSRHILKTDRVELGGGVGALGSALLTDEQQYQYAQYKAARAKGESATSPTLSSNSSAHSYNMYASPTGSLFPPPTSSSAPPVPPKTNAPTSPPPSLGLPSFGLESGWAGIATGSSRSIATMASASTSASDRSGNIRTPHGKTNTFHVARPSQSSTESARIGVNDSPPLRPKRVAGRWSPAPPGASDTVRSADKLPPPALPAMVQGPLPQTPASTESESAASKLSARLKGRTKQPPVALAINTGQPTSRKRLSDDWVRVDEFGDLISDLSPNRPAPAPPLAAPAQNHIPARTMLPLNGDAEGYPERRYKGQRSVTEPASSQNGGRQSSDMLRPSGQSAAGKKTTNGTQDSGKKTPTGLGIREGSVPGSSRSPSQPNPPTLKTRRSADLLRRPSAELLGFITRDKGDKDGKDGKEAKATSQRALGVGTAPSDEGRKVSGISLKKSSGALRNLFRNKGKEQNQDVPDMPRASTSDLLRPNANFMSGSVSSFSSSSSRRSANDSPGRASFSTERPRLPTPPNLQRAQSHTGDLSPPRVQSRTTVQQLFSGRELTFKDKGSNASREGRAPSASDTDAANSPSASTSKGWRNRAASSSASTTPSSSVTATPSSSITPLASAGEPQASASPAGSDGALSAGSSSTIRQVADFSTARQSDTEKSPGQAPLDWSPVKPSKSLRLLQLPELDLAFDFGFDAITMGSPKTPRRTSPPNQETSGGASSTPPSHGQPVISGKMLQRSPSERSKRAERRRSKSLDGHGANNEEWRVGVDPTWMSPNVAKFFSTSSTSAPVLAAPVEVSPKDAYSSSVATPAVPSDGKSVSTLHSSSDHARTPSGGSSTLETSSPSPPHTPEDANSAFLAAAPMSLETAKVSTPMSLGSPMTLAAPLEIKSTAPARAAPKSTAPPARVAPKSTAPQRVAPIATAAKGTKVATKAPEPVKTPQPAPTHAVVAAVAPAPAPAPAAEPAEPKPIPPSKAPFRARSSARMLVNKATVILPDPNVAVRDLSQELERILDNFRYPMQGGGPERSMIVRTELLAYLAEVDRRCYNRREEAAYSELRDVCFDWAEALLFELRVEQPANERGACLEGLGAILESQCFAAESLESSRTHSDAFLQLMMRVMNFVMDKLGAKGVFHNTLLFSGRFLAYAFFRIPHVGGQLVGVLQPPRGSLMRFTRPVLLGKSIPAEAKPVYPAHLSSLCFDDSQSYTRRLLSLDPDFDTAAEKEAFHFQPGNWLRRWQSDDSELFPAFYRAYHRQLAIYLAPAVEYYQAQNKPVPAFVLFRAPGYAHLATIFAKKCHSYILGSVNAVTTSSSNQHFDATESAGFRGSQKPPVLETANRRLVETMWTFASSIVTVPTMGGRVIECDGSQLWGEMVDLWVKNLISKTSLYAPKGVFCLFDLLDGVVDPVIIGSADSPLDVPYLVGLVRTILNQAEHALTLVKVIAFVFTHWEILTARPEDRRELCLDILLERKLFERLLLFWSQSVRSYVLRLVVFRLGHLHTTKADGLSNEVEIESVRLLQTRLDGIKRRHDELEPRPASDIVEMEANSPHTPRTPTGMPRSRSTITMITDSPQPSSKAEKLLALGMGKEEDKDGKSKGSWWKRTLGMPGGKPNAKTPIKKSPASSTKSKKSPASASSPSLPDSSPLLPSPRMASHLNTPSGMSGGSSPLARPSNLEQTRLLPSAMKDDGSPSASSPTSFGSSSSPRTRKAPPPHILTTGPMTPPGTDAATQAAFAFEFELPTASPRSDAFDFGNSPASERRNSQPPTSPRGQSSPHMSHSFSKRSSLLPPSTANALEAIGPGTSRVPRMPRDPGYAARLHAYAIRMLAELEDAQKEYDEWWADGGIGKVDGAPPRLAVAWPFHEGED